MSGHSKWHNIRVKKGAADAQRGKIFTRHGHLITIAARSGGGDPTTNSNLRFAIDNARKDNVPNSNIERAVKRGTGELKDSAEISEISYEGYGPEGVAVIVECLTDNKNRTLTNVRSMFDKRGGKMTNSGSVGWMFDRKGLIETKVPNGKTEELELLAIDAGADDIQTEGETMEIYTPFNSLHQVAEALKSKGMAIEKAEIVMKPKEYMRIDDPHKAKKILDFMDAMESDPDVTNVFANFDIPDDVAAKIEE
jgi:YebC/PmpR family DNA-binding regulatory protein